MIFNSFNKKVNKEDLEYMKSQQNLLNQYKIDLDEGLDKHNKRAFIKCCETLTFLIRDLAYINVENIESCIHCLRTFVEACVSGEHRMSMKTKQVAQKQQGAGKQSSRPMKKSTTSGSIENLSNSAGNMRSAGGSNTVGKLKSIESDNDDDDNLVTSYETVSIQLLDLLDVLHNKASVVFGTSANNADNEKQIKALLWSKCWCPILQGIARLSCDVNSEVRMHALQYLQRALLIQDLQSLSAIEWEACFNKVRTTCAEN
jgi:brefeldin A-resistance guanine nucleotide exchange factor 1